MYKAIFINPKERTVQFGEIASDEDIRAFLQCELITIGSHNAASGDMLIVDEEGAIVPKDLGSFLFNGQVFYGRGLIVGDGQTDFTSPHTSIEAASRLVNFGA